TVKVRVNVDNPQLLLKPEMFRHGRVYPTVAAKGRVMAAELAGKWIGPMHPEIILYDEPTAGLDLHYQLTILEILRRLTEKDRLLVVVVTHDINLAARYCTHLLLLHEGRVIQSGQPEDVVRPEVLERVYAVRLTSMARPEAEAPWVLPLSPLPAQADDGGVPRPTGREEGGG
ncbi:MAG: hypothetical protein ACE5FC_10380, partial [Myxococcota bacterium]